MLTKQVKYGILLVFLLGFSSLVAAQNPLNELEKAKYEVLSLKAALYEAQLKNAQMNAELASCKSADNNQAIRSEAVSLKQAIESTRPGYVFNVQTGQLEPIKGATVDGGKRQQQ